jgi:hypothetical protein
LLATKLNKIKQTKYNEVACSEESGHKTNSAPAQGSPTMVAEEFPTPQVSSLQLYVTIRGN